jgi:hypothetical protein
MTRGILLGSNNVGKLEEIQALFNEFLPHHGPRFLPSLYEG